MDLKAGLENTAGRLDALCRPLTVAQASFRPTPEAWSVDQCIEHLVTTERFTMISIRRAIQTEAASETEQGEVAAKSEFLRQRMTTRLIKVQAPPQAQPTGRYGLWPQALEEFQAVRQALLALAAAADSTWDAKLSPHPLLGNFSASQWLIFAGSHMERHLAQIEEVLANPDFPRSLLKNSLIQDFASNEGVLYPLPSAQQAIVGRFCAKIFRVKKAVFEKGSFSTSS